MIKLGDKAKILNTEDIIEVWCPTLQAAITNKLTIYLMLEISELCFVWT